MGHSGKTACGSGWNESRAPRDIADRTSWEGARHQRVLLQSLQNGHTASLECGGMKAAFSNRRVRCASHSKALMRCFWMKASMSASLKPLLPSPITPGGSILRYTRTCTLSTRGETTGWPLVSARMARRTSAQAVPFGNGGVAGFGHGGPSRSAITGQPVPVFPRPAAEAFPPVISDRPRPPPGLPDGASAPQMTSAL